MRAAVGRSPRRRTAGATGSAGAGRTAARPAEWTRLAMSAQTGSRRMMFTAQRTIASRIVQPTRAAMAATSRTEPDCWS